MKVLLLSDINSPHTIKWVNGLTPKGIDIYLFSLPSESKRLCKNEQIGLKKREPVSIDNKSDISKLHYITSVHRIRRVIKDYQPDILHAHYATSYGLIGAISGFHPYILSVWGSDVFQFPNKSVLHRKLLQYNLKKADKILSTSQIMADEVSKYTNKNVAVTPFGIDMNIFKPQKVNSIFNDDDIVVGTIKSLEANYGIEYLIRAFKILYDKYTTLPLKLMIVGEGSQRQYLETLAAELGISNRVYFIGGINYNEINRYHNMISIFVNIPEHESFGVSVLEASACGKPVIVSCVGGLKEIVKDRETGIMVPPKDAVKTAGMLEKLILNKQLAKEIGSKGRERVQALYNWHTSLQKMLKIYNNILS